MDENKQRTANSTFAIGGVQCSADTFYEYVYNFKGIREPFGVVVNHPDNYRKD